MTKYVCPMHPSVVSENPGKCSKCSMVLVEMPDKMSAQVMQHGHSMQAKEMDHSIMMGGPKAAAEFLHRFFIVTALLVPLAIFSTPAVKYLGVADFASRRYLEFAFATAIFYFGLIFFKHAKMEIAMKQYGMMTLVSMGVGAGYLFSTLSTFIPALNTEFYLEISTLIWVLLFGHFLEAKSSTAAGDALQEVAKLLPKDAHLKTGDNTKDVEIASLKEGDIVIVKPGEKVPADGIIIKGSANFNESHITGESKPVEKKVKDQVVAGSINQDGLVEIKLTRVGSSSTIGQIQYLISSAKQTKPSAQKLADRASKWLTFSALSVSVITLIFWSLIANQPLVFAATLAITVLVIACPHALGLAIPTVSTIATRLAVKNGVFIKDMAKIEVVKGANYVVFDKTGTLTKGKFGVTDIKILDGGKNDLLSAAASLESSSSHVIAYAIVKYVKSKNVPFDKPNKVKNFAGMGLSAYIKNKRYYVGNKKLIEKIKLFDASVKEEYDKLSSDGQTPVLVANKDKVLGILGLSDAVKDESVQAVAELHQLGLKVAMLTGDTKSAAEPVAKKLGIDTVFAEVLPEDKYKYVKKLQDEGNVVVMAGDGVNDAPALTQANTGVAIGAGTDVAVEAGDIVLTQSNPEHLVRLIILARKVYKKMLQNLFWAAGYNIIAIPAAAGLFVPFGFRLTPAVGAFVMSISSVIVVANALTLRKVRLTI